MFFIGDELGELVRFDLLDLAPVALEPSNSVAVLVSLQISKDDDDKPVGSTIAFFRSLLVGEGLEVVGFELFDRVGVGEDACHFARYQPTD